MDRGDVPMVVMSAKGELHHWRDDPRAADTWAEHPREDITGLYDVGDASFDITGLDVHARPLDLDDDTVGLPFRWATVS